MCLAIPGKIIKLTDKTAQVSYPDNIVNQAMIADVPANIGDFVLVQMGIVIKVLTKKEARLSQQAWQQKTPPTDRV